MAYETPPWTQIIAHRGNSGPLPENTLVAIDSAIELGVDMVEVDVRLDRDGVPILMHDDRVEHTTTGTGFVSEFTRDELRSLDAGSWRGAEFEGEPVCSLQDVLESTVGRVALNLDIKTPDAAEPAAIAAAAVGASADVVISGCTERSVRRVRDVASDISTLLNLDELLTGVHPTDGPSVALESVDVANELGAVAINVPFALIDANLVDRARTVGIGVWAFTVDDERRFSELVALGVDSLTTNWPERMLPLMRDGISRRRTNHT